MPIEAAVTSIFGAENLEISEYQNIMVYRGKEPGQVLYQVRMPDYLLVSNSSEGWQKTLRTATGKEEVSLKASGRIVIYNNYNTAKQRLVRNTRFETPPGFIYRINKSIDVPGQTTEAGRTIPGSIEVTIHA